MDIAASAREHGVSDADIRHAISLPLRIARQDEDRQIVIGADRDGQLLEIVVLDPDDEPVVIHAMKLRPKNFYLLR